jgi:uncharacterized protein (TIGR03083 family)
MSNPLEPLSTSVARLHGLVEPMDESQLTASAYPTEWTVADVLSHLGSAAVIFDRRIDDSISGASTPAEFSQSVWDEWNAKSPNSQASDSLAAVASLLEVLRALSPEDRGRVKVNMGPVELDFDALVGLSLNEHVLHTWDIEVTSNSNAVLAPDAVETVLTSLGLIARFAARPTDAQREIVVTTSDPTRVFTFALSPDAVSMSEGGEAAAADVRLPAEAFIRLVYGRLDRDHTPSGVAEGEDLDELRKVFPGL